jgi:hypothetical protein
MSVKAEEDGNYTNGEIYEYIATGAELGLGSHTFQFAASDGIEDATGDTGSHSGPTVSPPPSGGGGGGGGGGGAPPTPTAAVCYTDLSLIITSDGALTADVTATSCDGKIELTIDKGTTARTSDDEPIASIAMAEMLEPPSPPEGSNVVGLTYDMGPEGAIFDPPITLTFTYDPGDIPEGVNEEDLVIAVWDEDTSDWTTLEGAIVDPVTHTITAPVSHFSVCAILAYTSPATFITTALTVSPATASVGETVTISLLVTNTGNLRGSHTINLVINGESVSTKEVTLASGASETVNFSMSGDTAGEYRLAVGGQYGSFIVSEPGQIAEVEMPTSFAASNLSVNPKEVTAGQSVTISVDVTNTGSIEGTYTATLKVNGAVERTTAVTLAAGASKTIEFTVSREVVGNYEVEIDGLKGEYRVLPAPLAISWLLLGGVVGAVIVLGLATVFLVRRRKTVPAS